MVINAPLRLEGAGALATISLVVQMVGTRRVASAINISITTDSPSLFLGVEKLKQKGGRIFLPLLGGYCLIFHFYDSTSFLLGE